MVSAESSLGSCVVSQEDYNLCMMLKAILNAFLATLYIVLVALVMNYMTKQMGNKPDTVFGPMAAMALLTLSAAVMGYLFFFQPVQLYLDGKKKEGINLFLRTLGIFATITVIVFAVLLTGLVR